MLTVVPIQDYEDSRVRVSVLDSEGEPIFPDLIWYGEFVSLCTTGHFLLLETSVHSSPLRSFLMTPEPRVKRVFDFGLIRTHGVSPDGAIFWVQTYEVAEDKPIARLRVLRASGDQLVEKDFSTQATETVLLDGREYEISILEPSWPI